MSSSFWGPCPDVGNGLPSYTAVLSTPGPRTVVYVVGDEADGHAFHRAILQYMDVVPGSSSFLTTEAWGNENVVLPAGRMDGTDGGGLLRTRRRFQDVPGQGCRH